MRGERKEFMELEEQNQLEQQDGVKERGQELSTNNQ